MSRIGRLPVIIPEKVTVDITADNVIIVTGPLGSLRQEVDKVITLEKTTIEDHTHEHAKHDAVILTRTSEDKEVRAKHGLYRALIANMVEGVTKGYSKSLTINGVGFKCAVTGNKLVLNIGFSHPVNIEIPQGIKITCPSTTEIKIEGIDKTKVGQVAADIKAIKPVEPYHAYGIRYTDQYVVRKEIKKVAKKK